MRLHTKKVPFLAASVLIFVAMVAAGCSPAKMKTSRHSAQVTDTNPDLLGGPKNPTDPVVTTTKTPPKLNTPVTTPEQRKPEAQQPAVTPTPTRIVRVNNPTPAPAIVTPGAPIVVQGRRQTTVVVGPTVVQRPQTAGTIYANAPTATSKPVQLKSEVPVIAGPNSSVTSNGTCTVTAVTASRSAGTTGVATVTGAGCIPGHGRADGIRGTIIDQTPRPNAEPIVAVQLPPVTYTRTLDLIVILDDDLLLSESYEISNVTKQISQNWMEGIVRFPKDSNGIPRGWEAPMNMGRDQMIRPYFAEELQQSRVSYVISGLSESLKRILTNNSTLDRIDLNIIADSCPTGDCRTPQFHLVSITDIKSLTSEAAAVKANLAISKIIDIYYQEISKENRVLALGSQAISQNANLQAAFSRSSKRFFGIQTLNSIALQLGKDRNSGGAHAMDKIISRGEKGNISFILLTGASLNYGDEALSQNQTDYFHFDLNLPDEQYKTLSPSFDKLSNDFVHTSKLVKISEFTKSMEFSDQCISAIDVTVALLNSSQDDCPTASSFYSAIASVIQQMPGTIENKLSVIMTRPFSKVNISDIATMKNEIIRYNFFHGGYRRPKKAGDQPIPLQPTDGQGFFVIEDINAAFADGKNILLKEIDVRLQRASSARSVLPEFLLKASQETTSKQ
jgi:hypothetical protein